MSDKGVFAVAIIWTAMVIGIPIGAFVGPAPISGGAASILGAMIGSALSGTIAITLFWTQRRSDIANQRKRIENQYNRTIETIDFICRNIEPLMTSTGPYLQSLEHLRKQVSSDEDYTNYFTTLPALQAGTSKFKFAQKMMDILVKDCPHYIGADTTTTIHEIKNKFDMVITEIDDLVKDSGMGIAHILPAQMPHHIFRVQCLRGWVAYIENMLKETKGYLEKDYQNSIS